MPPRRPAWRNRGRAKALSKRFWALSALEQQPGCRYRVARMHPLRSQPRRVPRPTRPTSNGKTRSCLNPYSAAQPVTRPRQGRLEPYRPMTNMYAVGQASKGLAHGLAGPPWRATRWDCAYKHRRHGNPCVTPWTSILTVPTGACAPPLDSKFAHGLARGHHCARPTRTQRCCAVGPPERARLPQRRQHDANRISRQSDGHGRHICRRNLGPLPGQVQA